MFVILSLVSLLASVHGARWSYYDTRYVQCYSCSDCPEPFFYFPNQVMITPPDVGHCMKTVVHMADSNRLLVSKGFTRNCIAESSINARVFCCQSNLCNRSGVLHRSISLLSVMLLLLICF